MNKLYLYMMLGVASCTPKKESMLPYEPYKPFSIVVSQDEWHGKLEPGRYTKSGVLIIKQQAIP